MMIDHDDFLPAVVMMSNTLFHVKIYADSAIVFTTTTTHNTVLGTTVPNAPHFLCPAKVSTLLSIINVQYSLVGYTSVFGTPLW